ncbi:hypothetical protein BGZ47_007353 [Haplosporangium gracile]|nr:hypothetical protein BGZ47_007353 [Haplosporangium gracile]
MNLTYTRCTSSTGTADYNNPERILARQVWTQAFLELAASIMDAVFVNMADFNVHMVCRFERAPRGRSPHLNAAESNFSSIIKHVRLQDFGDRESLTDYINNGIQGIILVTVEGWIGEISRNFAKANRGEPLGQSYDNHDLVGEEEKDDE